MNLGLLWPKLFPALVVFVVFVAVYRLAPSASLRSIAAILAAMLARDVLFSLAPWLHVSLLVDIVIMVLYVLWVRSLTGWRASDTVFAILNAAVCAAALVNIVFPLVAESDFFLGLWLILNVAYLAVAMGLVSPMDGEKTQIILRSRFVLTAALFIDYLVVLLYGYDNGVVQAILVPASYLIPAYLLITCNALAHGEREKSVQFYASNLDSTYGFMENLGNAITAKIDLAQVQEIIISAAVRIIGADAGVILMVDEYEDILRVRATYGIYPPLGPVPELARVTPASLKRFFAETPIPIGETVLGETVKTGSPTFIRDTHLDERMRENTRDDILFVSSLAAVPLVVRGRVLGVLSVIKRAEGQLFEERDYGHLSTLAEYASITIDNLYTYLEVLEKREFERELDIAARIQQKLLPARLPELDTAALAVYSLPAKGVSGDYYDVFRVEKDKLAMAVCDVAGKGIPAAMVMVMIRSILHLIVSPQRGAAATLNLVNHGITGRIDLDHYATIGFLVYDETRREILYSNAAHLPLLVYKQSSGKTFKVDTSGLPIGIEKRTQYEERRFPVEKGDCVLLFTDGILEAMNPPGQQYGLGSLRRVVERCAVLPADELVRAVREDLGRFVGSARQHDDQTLLVMKAL
jgi:sigma-B regulation protein RsbU (phosphoserine phosphatase)